MRRSRSTSALRRRRSRCSSSSAIGIPIGELWGPSETCGLGTINPPDKIKLGTVGPPTPGVEIKLDDDGEVLVKRTA